MGEVGSVTFCPLNLESTSDADMYSSAQGAMFAPIVLTNLSNPSPSATSLPSSSERPTHNSASSHVGAIVGSVLGGLIALVAAVSTFVWYRRRRTLAQRTSTHVQPYAVVSTRSRYISEDEMSESVPAAAPARPLSTKALAHLRHLQLNTNLGADEHNLASSPNSSNSSQRQSTQTGLTRTTTDVNAFPHGSASEVAALRRELEELWEQMRPPRYASELGDEGAA